MATKQLYIPDKLKIGFQKRGDTYTEKLAYVIYYDKTGTLRKEKSWESWRDKQITPLEINNEPTEGFVLNKKVGGYKSHWNFRDAHVRVYDPRDFEFEISVPNLLFILTQCDCSRGKGLEGKFVYAWEGTELVLLPVASEDYKMSQNFTDLQTKKVKAKELIPGASYMTKKQETLTYLGRFDYHYMEGYRSYNSRNNVPTKARVEKKYVFWNDSKAYESSKSVIGFVYMNEPKTIATLVSDTPHPDFAKLVETYHKSSHGTPVTRLFLKAVAEKKSDDAPYYYDRENWFYEEEPGVFLQCTTHRNYSDKKIEYIEVNKKFYVKDGVMTEEDYNAIGIPAGMEANYQQRHGYGWRYGHGYSYNQTPRIPYREPTNDRLFAELESGSKFRVEYNTFSKD